MPFKIGAKLSAGNRGSGDEAGHFLPGFMRAPSALNP